MSAYGYDGYYDSGYEGGGSYAYGGYTVYGGPFLDAYGEASIGHPSYASDVTASGIYRTSYFYVGYDGGFYRHDTNGANGYYAQTTRSSFGYGAGHIYASDTSYYHSYDASEPSTRGYDVQSYFHEMSSYSASRDGGSVSYVVSIDVTTYDDGSSYLTKDYAVNGSPSSGIQSHGYDLTASTNAYGYTTYTYQAF